MITPKCLAYVTEYQEEIENDVLHIHMIRIVNQGKDYGNPFRYRENF